MICSALDENAVSYNT